MNELETFEKQCKKLLKSLDFIIENPTSTSKEDRKEIVMDLKDFLEELNEGIEKINDKRKPL